MAPPKSNANHPDPFTDTMVHEDTADLMPFSLDRDALRSMDPSAVLIAKWPKPLPTRYYRNLLPDLQVIMCPVCLQVVAFNLVTTQYGLSLFFCSSGFSR